MRRISDQDQIETLKNSSMISTFFDPEHLDALHFEGEVYEDGELIQSPLKPLEGFLFIMEGSARIYGIREDGTAVSITIVGRGRILGDMEYTAGIGRPHGLPLSAFYGMQRDPVEGHHFPEHTAAEPGRQAPALHVHQGREPVARRKDDAAH